MSDSIQYGILSLGVIIFVAMIRNVFGNYKKPFNPMNFNTGEKLFFYILLLVGTIGLIFYIISPTKNLLGKLVPLLVLFILWSFFIIYTFEALLDKIRDSNLSLSILLNPHFLIIAHLVILLELAVLYNFYDIAIYTSEQFKLFILAYSFLLILIGVFLGIRKQRKVLFTSHWKIQNRKAFLIVLCDPIFVIFLIGIIFLMVYHAILFLDLG